MAPKKSKNQLRREKAKQKKQSEGSKPAAEEAPVEIVTENVPPETKLTPVVINTDAPEFAAFQSVFSKFESVPEPVVEEVKLVKPETQVVSVQETIVSSDEEEVVPVVTKKHDKPTLAQLKSGSSVPELIEWYDADAKDPLLTVAIKATPNVVPVPTHWQLKRDYLSSKVRYIKPPFRLPKFIADTGITEMRDTTKEDESSLKELSRQQVQPKMGKLDIDYQKLHDAFFKFQTKPHMLKFGDLFYEGRETGEEYVSRKSKFRPGKLSETLVKALDLSPGAVPAWCKNMATHGLPPSYPSMKVSGINWDRKPSGGMYATIEEVKQRKQHERFGKVLSFEEESEEESEEEEEQQSEEEPEEEKQEPQYTDIPLNSLEETPVVVVDDGPKQLYTVLEANTEGLNTKYNIPKRKASEDEGPIVKKPKIDDDEEFKF